MALKFPKFLKITAVRSQKLLPNTLESDGSGAVYIYDAQLLSLLKEVLAFKFQLLFPTDGLFGIALPDGSWNGMVGMLQRGEADIAIGRLGITEERSLVVNFTQPYHFSPVTFITDKPEFLPNSYAITNPFSVAVWIAIVVQLFIVLLISCAFKIEKGDFQKLLLKIYGSLLQVPTNYRLQGVSAKLLIFSWIVGSMLITYSYKAVLLSFLTFPSSTGIRDIPELAAASEDVRFICSTYPSAYIYPALLNASEVPLKKVAECMRRSDNFTRDIEEFLGPSTHKKAFVGERSDLFSYHKGYFISDDEFFVTMLAIAVRKNFCCMEVLDRLIYEFAKFGFLYKMDRDLEFFSALRKTYLKNDDEVVRDGPLSLEDLSMVFTFLVSGYAVAITMLVVEIAVGCRKMRNET